MRRLGGGELKAESSKLKAERKTTSFAVALSLELSAYTARSAKKVEP
jgi:hypothetical protein